MRIKNRKQPEEMKKSCLENLKASTTFLDQAKIEVMKRCTIIR